MPFIVIVEKSVPRLNIEIVLPMFCLWFNCDHFKAG
ncbi:hypothetical protein BVRB_4g082060 [Beta vulgaris subsp. vulgaris]|nr:hypothetical protein BVRB_4g082060 [Beta vulgaris subsp. vulgaris]